LSRRAALGLTAAYLRGVRPLYSLGGGSRT
jgi:hypothetical protein